MSDENKQMKGQFFTINNPFGHESFFDWMNLIPTDMLNTIIEPFCGSNNIVKMINELGYEFSWKCFDIEPPEVNVTPEWEIIKQDTINNFPEGYHVAITNPPYLAKNSAKRRKFDFPESEFDDLYKISLNVMLDNLEYVAAIIPESFITANVFHDRLYSVISLTQKMFDDTECPVCLALFIPADKKKEIELSETDFNVYIQNQKIGKYLDISNKKIMSNISNDWTFNDPNGNIGIICIDSIEGKNIKFIDGENIDSSKIKVSSRAFTRLSGLPEDIDFDEFILKCNQILEKYRNDTYDLFLTSFKGLRKDNYYRRRLDFATARSIMNKAIEDIRNN